MSERHLLSREICGVVLGLWLAGAAAAPGANAKLPDEESTWAWTFEHDVRRGELTKAHAEAAVDAAGRSNDPVAELLAIDDLIAVHWDDGCDKEALARSRRLTVLARSLGNDAWVARGMFDEALCLADNKSLDPGVDSQSLRDESMRIARQLGLNRLLADNYLEQAGLDTVAGRGSEAIADLKQARDLYESVHENFGLAVSSVKLAGGYRNARTPSPQDLQTAERLLTQAIDLYDPQIDKADIAYTLIEKGQTQLRLGNFDAAAATLKAASEAGTRGNHPEIAALADLRLGQALLERDRPAEALPYLENAPGAIAKAPWHWETQVVAAWDALAKAQARLGHRREALQALDAANDALKSANVPQVAADVHAAEAQVWTALGDDRRANEALRQQMASAAEAAHRMDEARMQELRARFESDLKDRDNALLRARTAQAESRRTAALLALGVVVLVLGGGALVLQMRLSAIRAANRLMATLADDGRQMTSGLDRPALVEMLKSRLDELLAPASTAVWLVDDAGSLVRVDRPSQPHALESRLQAIRDRCELDMAAVSTRPVVRGAMRWWPWRMSPGALCVAEPLLNGTQLLGIVALGFDEGRRWRNRERQVVRTTCLYAAVALANIRTAQLLGESQVELEQERTRDMLVHTARLVTVGSMASGIVHEMSHPVGAMMLQSSNAQASLEIGESVEANEALSGIHREARRLQNLITRLRNLCRADPPRIEDIDLLDVLEDAHVLFQPQLQMARVEFVQDAASLVVAVDAERVVLAIANIVFNAVDAMEGRPVKRIEITASARDGFACVDIRDTGPGLTPTQLARLFEPFYTTKPPGKGLGLGLALSVKSVASMNGRIEAANHPDGGAVFSICVPLAVAQATSKPRASTAAGW